MILRKIRIENWRRYLDPCEFQFEEGVNILHGPNEAGKSTVFDALTKAFFAKHSSATAEMKTLHPLSTSLAPKVMVEFFHQGVEYSAAKTFLKNVSSEVRVQRGGSWQKQAEGDEADRLLREILSGPDSTKRTLEPSVRGLAEALWSLQGEGALPESSWSDAIKSGLGDLVDIASLTDLDQRFVNRVHKVYEESFQPRRAGYKVNSEVQKAIDERTAAAAELKDLQVQVQRAEDLVAEITREEESLAKAKAKVEVSEREEEEARLACEGASQFEQDKAAWDKELLSRKTSLEMIQKDSEAVASLQSQLKDLGTDERSLLTAVNDLKVQGAASQRQIDELRSQRTGLVQKIEEAERRLAALDAAGRKRKLEKEIEDLDKLLTQIADQEKKISQASVSIKELGAPDEAAYEGYLALVQDRTIAQVRLKAVGARLTLTGGLTLQTDLEPDEDGAYSIHGESSFTIPEKGGFTIATMASDAGELKAKHDSLGRDVSAFLARYRADSHEDLTSRFTKRKQLEGDLKDAERSAKLLQAQRPNPQDLLSKARQGLADEVPKAEAVAAETKGWGGEQIRAAVDQTSSELKLLKSQSSSIEKTLNVCEENLRKVQTSMGEAQVKVATISGQTIQTELQLTDLLAKYGTKPLLESALKQAEESFNDAKTKHQEAERDFYIKVTAPKEKLELARTAAATARERVQTLMFSVTSQRGQLKGMGLVQMAEKIEKAEARLERAERAQERAISRAEATKALFEAVEKVRNDQVRAVSRPITTIINGWLPRLSDRFEQMELDENLIPNSLLSTGYAEGLPVGLLSFGTKEQVALMVRLALAWHLGETERQLVVLDDRLVNADTERRNSMCGIIAQLARERCQVILSTCNVEDYDALAGRRIDVQSQSRRHAGS